MPSIATRERFNRIVEIEGKFVENLEDLKLVLEIVTIVIAWSESFPLLAILAGLGAIYLILNKKRKTGDTFSGSRLRDRLR